MGGWLKFLLILRLSQPSLAGVGAGAELGNKKIVKIIGHCQLPVNYPKRCHLTAHARLLDVTPKSLGAGSQGRNLDPGSRLPE